MIGLGSNRMSVCRRGGMSVTQAGRGGMEWLAGDRMPSWSSPYSAQATAALLAQFPTQWPTIRDYGFAHPEIVGYMNAYAPEDAKIAYSLVEGIGVRKLLGNGSSYFDTGIGARTPLLSFDCLADIKGMSGYPKTLFGVIDSYGGGTGMYGFINHGTGGNAFRYGLYNSNYVASGVANNTDNVHLEGIVGDSTIELKVNGVSKGTATKGTPINKSIYMFRANCYEPGPVNSNIAYLRLYTPTGNVGWFVPFVRNGQNECLDLVSGNLATRTGSFTISETPAS